MNPYYSRYYTFIKPILRNKQVQNYSSISFSLMLIIIFVIFAIKPTLETIVSLGRSITQQKQIYQQLLKKADNLSLGKKNYQALEETTRTKMEELIPDKADVTQLLAALNSAALASSASISGIQIQPVELTQASPQSSGDKKEEILFAFNLTGTYDQAINFLNSLKSSPRLISIKSVAFGKKEADQLLVVTINGIAYVMR